MNLLVLYLLEQGKHKGYVIICDVHTVFMDLVDAYGGVTL
jgi:hypothetical protein